MKVETYQVGSRDLNEEPTKLGAEDGLLQRFPKHLKLGHGIRLGARIVAEAGA